MSSDIESFRAEYEQIKRKKILFLLGIVVIIAVLTGYGVTVGTSGLSVGDSYGAIIDGLYGRLASFISGESYTTQGEADIILWDFRLHRILFAIAAGFGLAVSGTVMQGILRNPLASPFTLGIASAASCGASVAIVLGAGILTAGGDLLVITNAFIFAMAASFAIYGMARRKGMQSSSMILAGIAVMYLFSAVTSMLQYFGTTDQAAEVVYWMFGSLNRTTWQELGIVTLMLVIIVPWLVWKSWDLNALSEGDEIAKSLGIPVEKRMTVFMIVSSLVTAAIIAFTGTIGFIGLVAPHIARMATGSDHRILIAASGLVGAAVLLSADIAGRVVLYPSTIPVGIMTAFIGVPFFLYLFMKRGE